MTIPVSSAPAVKAYLVDTLIPQTLSPDTGGTNPDNSVFYDEPSGNTTFGDTTVVVGNVTQTQEPHAFVGGGGTGWMNESYRVEITISVYRGGENARTADARLWQVYGQIGQAVRVDPSLDGLVTTAYLAALDTTSDWSDDDSGRIGTGTAHLHVDNRI